MTACDPLLVALGSDAQGAAVVSSANTDPYVELAGRSKKGRLFRKELITFGEYAHPNIAGDKMVIDQDVADAMLANFEAGVCDIVQMPVCDGTNQHTEDPLANIGEVIGLEVAKNSKGEDAIFATCDVRKNADDVGNTLLGISGMIHFNYPDTKTGEKVGPTLLHAAVTNRPYVTGLDGFEELIAASADQLGEDEPVFLTPVAATEEPTTEPTQVAPSTKPTQVEPEEPRKMDLEELKKLLSEEHSIDLDALMARPEQVESATPAVEPEKIEAAALSAVRTALEEAGVKLAAPAGEDEVTTDDVLNAISELAEDRVSLSNRVLTLEKDRADMKLEAATRNVDDLIKEGRVLPAQKDAYVKLSISDPETFTALIPASPIVNLSEKGVTTTDEPPNEEVSAEIDRLTSLAVELAGARTR